MYRTWIPAEAKALDQMNRARQLRFPPGVMRDSERAVEAVRRDGDAGIIRIVRKYDRVALTPRTLRVTPSAIAAAWRGLVAADRKALAVSWKNILAFHRKQAPKGYVLNAAHGKLRQAVVPLERVGIHIPAASGPLVSTLLMCAGAARAAGVKELVLISPPKGGAIHPVILAGAHVAGITEAYNAGGPAGIAALVFGTRTIRRVDKVVGPGNLYSQAAKLLTQGGGGLEGPSEIVVLADDSAPPSVIAADLVAQAEHAGDNLCVLVTPSRGLVLRVLEEVLRQMQSLPRSKQAATSLSDLGVVVLVKTMREGLAWANRFAPEHLEIVARGADALARGVRHAGTVLVGPASPVAAADYGVGPNHVLPTSGTARYASGLGVKDFVKTMNVTRLSAQGLRRLAPSLARIARLEGLEGHARSMEMNRG